MLNVVDCVLCHGAEFMRIVCVNRYIAEFKRLADSHWPENLLLVTHEYGVISAMMLGGCTRDTEATYCGSVELLRREETQHKWTIVKYHGVYMYDNVSDM